MKHFSDLIKNTEFSANKEIKSLNELLQKDFGYYSLNYQISNDFIKFSKRGPYISFKEFKEFVISSGKTSEESLIFYCEMLLNFINEIYINDNYIPNHTFEEIIIYLISHIYGIVDRIQHKVVRKDNGEIIIVPKEKKSIQAAEIIAETDESIAIKILEYKHFSNTVDDKKQILLSLANFLENKRGDLSKILLDEDDLFLNKKGKANLVDQMFEMFNSLYIRHANDKQYINKIDKEIEKWYDYTYNTVLTVIISLEQAKINKEFKELKAKKRS